MTGSGPPQSQFFFISNKKRCGQYNDMQGRENHLVKVQGVPGYEVPAKDSARLVDPLKAPKKKKQKSSA